MSILSWSVSVRAPLRRCFGLGRSGSFIRDLVGPSQLTGEEDAESSALLTLGESISLRFSYFKLSFEVQCEIVCLEPESFFRIEIKGSPFSHCHIDVYFDIDGEGFTKVTQVLEYALLGNVGGELIEYVLVNRLLREFLRSNGAALKQTAEGDGWKRYGVLNYGQENT